MSLNIVFLHHPNSQLTIDLESIPKQYNVININVGINSSFKNGYRESSDFHPTYACYNSILFESSCILTVWEHSESLFVDGPVIISHTDVIPRFSFDELLSIIPGDNYSIGTTIPSYIVDKYNTLIIDPKEFSYDLDPWQITDFDGYIDIWDLIRKIDPEAADWALQNNPYMIYSHQFMTDRESFEKLGHQLKKIIMPMKLEDCGLWTAHVFERIIAIRLAMLNPPIITSFFSHMSSSGPKGPGSMTLYGPRSYKHFKMFSKSLQHG